MLSKIARQLYLHDSPTTALGQLATHLRTIVDGAIIDQNNLDRLLCKDSVDSRNHFPDTSMAVEDGYDN